jgi:hypothetical protein
MSFSCVAILTPLYFPDQVITGNGTYHSQYMGGLYETTYMLYTVLGSKKIKKAASATKAGK